MREYRFFIIGLILVIGGGAVAYSGSRINGMASPGLGAVSGGVTPVAIGGALVAILGIGLLGLGVVRNNVRR